jgi:hypothetical protein
MFLFGKGKNHFRCHLHSLYIKLGFSQIPEAQVFLQIALILDPELLQEKSESSNFIKAHHLVYLNLRSVQPSESYLTEIYHKITELIKNEG